jgi:hypothetical protein
MAVRIAYASITSFSQHVRPICRARLHAEVLGFSISLLTFSTKVRLPTATMPDQFSKSSRLLKKTHMLRCRSIASLQRTVSTPRLLDFSRASHLDLFEQPARAFF